MFKPKLFRVCKASFTTKNVEVYVKRKSNIKFSFKYNALSQLISETAQSGKAAERGCNDGGSLVIRVYVIDSEIKFCRNLPLGHLATWQFAIGPILSTSNFCVMLKFDYHIVENSFLPSRLILLSCSSRTVVIKLQTAPTKSAIFLRKLRLDDMITHMKKF